MIIALDYGEKNIGVAITDKSETFVFPKCVIDTNLFETNPEILRKKIKDFENVTKIIIGLPKNLMSKNTIQTEKVLQFYEKIKLFYPDKNLRLIDERLTSKIIEKEIKSIGKKVRDFKNIKDMYEAAIILEDYLRWEKR